MRTPGTAEDSPSAAQTPTPRIPERVVVIVPPWPFGSANIFAASVSAYAHSGRRVCLLIAQDNKTTGAHRSARAAQTAEQMRMEGADLVTHTIGRTRRRSRIRALGAALRGKLRDALAERANYIGKACLPEDFRAFADGGPVAIVHVHHCFNILLGEKVRSLVEKRHRARPRLICETHDIQAQNQDILNSRHPLTSRCSPASDIQQTELQLLSRADALIHLSPNDLAHFREHLPGKRHFHVPPTIAPASERALTALRGTAAAHGDIVYIGANNFWNVRTLVWLLDSVMPFLPGEQPRLAVYGNVAGGLRRRRPDLFAAFRQNMRGTPQDVVEIYRNARVALVPALGGTGASIKLIEAMCSGRPVAATSASLRGLSAEARAALGIPAHDDPAAFAAAVKGLLADPDPPVHAAFYDRQLSNAAHARAFAEAVAAPL